MLEYQITNFSIKACLTGDDMSPVGDGQQQHGSIGVATWADLDRRPLAALVRT